MKRKTKGCFGLLVAISAAIALLFLAVNLTLVIRDLDPIDRLSLCIIAAASMHACLTRRR